LVLFNLNKQKLPNSTNPTFWEEIVASFHQKVAIVEPPVDRYTLTEAFVLLEEKRWPRRRSSAS
jgi:hypothetical protein